VLLVCLQAYQGAVEVLSAVADRLRASPGRFFFGERPSSLDALLFGHLAFYRHSPVAAPVLRDKVSHASAWQPERLAGRQAQDCSCLGPHNSCVDGVGVPSSPQ
jgi:glutathione S-transferase